ncbi:hypothetical protein ACS0TY_033065 [Phlomoides rotata]
MKIASVIFPTTFFITSSPSYQSNPSHKPASSRIAGKISGTLSSLSVTAASARPRVAATLGSLPLSHTALVHLEN